MTTYIVTTPNPEYSERSFGVQFNKGRAVVDEETLDPHLGYTLDQVIHGLEKDLGYSVRKIGATSRDELIEKLLSDPGALDEIAKKAGFIRRKDKPRKKKEAESESLLPS